MRFHGKDLRKGRVSEIGRIYHVTVTTHQRKPLFTDLTAARIVIQTLSNEQKSRHATTIAFVLMPDHLHWLMQLNHGEISDVVGRVKAVSAHRVGQKLWQSGFYDHALRQEEDLRTVARYIVANPLRGGLVNRIEEYPHWDAIWL